VCNETVNLVVWFQVNLNDGRTFSYMKLTKLLPQLSANPMIASRIARYPERTIDGVVRQLNQVK
jgi:hypothetical protein